jgi:hypothetical protein
LPVRAWAQFGGPGNATQPATAVANSATAGQAESQTAAPAGQGRELTAGLGAGSADRGGGERRDGRRSRENRLPIVAAGRRGVRYRPLNRSGAVVATPRRPPA